MNDHNKQIRNLTETVNNLYEQSRRVRPNPGKEILKGLILLWQKLTGDHGDPPGWDELTNNPDITKDASNIRRILNNMGNNPNDPYDKSPGERRWLRRIKDLRQIGVNPGDMVPPTKTGE
tara:strand:- start:16 stop:375 length:360 start_codon:yes stop_codon:yes gene_type:complete